MMKKTVFLTVFLILILITNISFASYSTVTMSVVEEPVCTINIGENSKFEKKLIAKDLTNKEVTLQLQVINEEISEKPSGEIVLVLDNSDSMKEQTSTGEIRKNLVFNSAKNLVTNLLKNNNALKVGIVSFSTNTDISKEGTIEDATVISDLSNNASNLTTAIDTIETNGPRTNLESGLTLANKLFTSEQKNKYMIILTDGVPNVAIDYDKTYYSDDVISKTKTFLQGLSSSGAKIITMLTGISDEKYVPATTTKSFGTIISEIFGTTQNPTAGQFYYITDDKIESTINEIYNSLVSTDKTFKNLKIVDYFPKEIVDNFDFAYVSKANIGNISAEIDKSNNSITWTIPELAVGQTATVQYKLKLKENFDSSIVGKILNTNEKVDITYTDYTNSTVDKTSDVTPKLKLVEPPPVLPKAGLTTIIIVGSALLIILVFSAGKLIAIKKKMD